MRAAAIFGGVVVALAVATGALAQKGPAPGPSRDQVRLRLLDNCVLTRSGKMADEGAGPACNCFAGRITKAMSNEEITGYSKGVPKRLLEEANKIWATCTKGGRS